MQNNIEKEMKLSQEMQKQSLQMQTDGIQKQSYKILNHTLHFLFKKKECKKPKEKKQKM